MNLGIYGLKDNNNILSTFTFGDDEKKVSKWYLNQLEKVCSDLDKNSNNIKHENVEDDKLNFFLLQTRKCKLVRIGFIDIESGELQNDFAILLDLKDFNYRGKNK